VARDATLGLESRSTSGRGGDGEKDHVDLLALWDREQQQINM
jgi:hypothetical protein